eukprot:633773-Prymnesium_polylepis.1
MEVGRAAAARVAVRVVGRAAAATVAARVARVGVAHTQTSRAAPGFAPRLPLRTEVEVCAPGVRAAVKVVFFIHADRQGCELNVGYWTNAEIPDRGDCVQNHRALVRLTREEDGAQVVGIGWPTRIGQAGALRAAELVELAECAAVGE